MSADLTKRLQGTRAEAESAVQDLLRKWKKFEKASDAASSANALNFELQVLRQLCLALQANCHQNADLYCQVVETMMPHMKPVPQNPVLWETHLNSLRYIHHKLFREETFKECKQFYEVFIAQPCCLGSESDAKVYLNIHIYYFTHCAQQLQKQPSAVENGQFYSALQSMGLLFNEMRQRSFSCVGLMQEINLTLLSKRAVLKVLHKLPAERITAMLDPLCKLLGSQSVAADQEGIYYLEYLIALLALLQLDMLSPVQPSSQWALYFLRHGCLALFKENSAQNFATKFIYTYMKLLFARDPTPDFKKRYVETCGKFVVFVQKQTKLQLREQWFMDTMLTLQRLQTFVICSNNKARFEGFWQLFEGEGSAEAYAAHLELIWACFSGSLNITSSSLGTSACQIEGCKSVRKHCILSFGICAIVAYQNYHSLLEEKKQPEEALTAKLQHRLLEIVNYLFKLLPTMKCMDQSNAEVLLILRNFANIAAKVNSASQIGFLLKLLKSLKNIKALIAPAEMFHILRRVNKASIHCSDPELAGQLQATFIAAQLSPLLQHQRITLFYRQSTPAPVQKCIFELHESSPLRCDLAMSQQRLLFDYDMSEILTYHRTRWSLLQSLWRCRQTDYHLVLIARHMRPEDATIEVVKELRIKLRRTGYAQSLTRLENLVAGHASAIILSNYLEAQKIKIPNKEAVETKLEELLVKYNRLDIHIGSELRLVNFAMEVVDGFTAFFNKADEEFIDSDEALIDWEALTEDLTAVALALNTMGYVPQADEAWLLLLRITRLLDDRFRYLRCLTHFLGSVGRHKSIEGISLECEVAHAQELLNELWPQLPKISLKRQHTIVMLCLCQMANYYAVANQLGHAQVLLEHVEHLRDQFADRRGKSDIVLLALQGVRFRMLYQHRRCPPMPKIPTALRLMDTLLDNIFGFQAISSVDAAHFMLLLCDLVKDCSECTTNRQSERLKILNSLLNSVLQTGLALRSVELLVSWLWMDLQMENLEMAQSKLRLIEHFLCVKMKRPLGSEESPKTSPIPVGKETDNQVNDLAVSLLQLRLHPGPGNVEPIRKQSQLAEGSTPPLNSLMPSPAKFKLQRYVSNHEDHTQLQQNKQLSLLYFIVGCLHARLCFLNREQEPLGAFYEQANGWLTKHNQSKADGQLLGHILLVQQLFQINFLRASGKHQEAIAQVETSLAFLATVQQRNLDINYGYNLLVQLKTVSIEVDRKLNPMARSKNRRRALKFNASPEKPKPVAQLAEVHSSSTLKSLVKPSKPIKFPIFVEEESPKSDVSPSSEDDALDLNACRVIEISEDEEDEVIMASPEPVVRPKRTMSAPLSVQESVTKRSQRNSPPIAVIDLDECDDVDQNQLLTKTLKRCKSTEVRSARSTRQRKENTTVSVTPNTTPESTTITEPKKRTRRQKTIPAPVEELATVTRRRQRN